MAKLMDIMTRDVIRIEPSASVADAAQAMVQGRFGSVVVIEAGWISGIFTERDVLRAAAAGADLKTTPLSEFMTRDPMTVSGDLDAAEAAEIMAAQGFRHLPVVDGSELLGIVSLRDVLSTRIARAPR